MMDDEKSKDEIEEDIKELVIARIETQLPSNLRLSIGSEGTLDKEEMIESVKAGNEQGKQIIDMHLNFMRAITSGELMREINAV